MGFFDFFRRKPKPEREQPLDDLLAELERDGERQRPGHYMLAHVALRQIALSDPLHFLALVASPKARDFISDIHARVAELCREDGETIDFTADEVKFHCVRAGQFPCAVIEMPKPSATPEAYFAALVGYVDSPKLPADLKKIPARYFTLEHGMAIDGGARTVLCEWTETAHSNFGDGPEPTIDAFIRALPQSARAEHF